MSDELRVIPDLIVHDGAAFASSLDVARVFGKRPDHVADKIGVMVAQAPECAPNFRETSRRVQMPRGGFRDEKAFELTRDGFALLAMGFTGARALRFKLAYIAKFNAMEAELRQGAERSFAALPAPALTWDDARALLDRFGRWHLGEVSKLLGDQKPGGVTSREVYEILERVLPGSVARSVGGTVKNTIANTATWTAAGMMPMPLPTDETTFLTPTEVCWRVVQEGLHPRVPALVGVWLLAAAREGQWRQGQTPRRSLRDRAQPTYPLDQVRRWIRSGGGTRIRSENEARTRAEAIDGRGVIDFPRSRDAGGK